MPATLQLSVRLAGRGAHELLLLVEQPGDRIECVKV